MAASWAMGAHNAALAINITSEDLAKIWTGTRWQKQDEETRRLVGFSYDINIEALCAAPPEAFAHSSSQMPLSCLASCAPISARIAQRQGGGGGGVARRARAARAPKAKSCATSCGTSSTALRRVVHVLVLHVSPKGRRGGGGTFCI